MFSLAGQRDVLFEDRIDWWVSSNACSSFGDQRVTWGKKRQKTVESRKTKQIKHYRISCIKSSNHAISVLNLLVYNFFFKLLILLKKTFNPIVGIKNKNRKNLTIILVVMPIIKKIISLIKKQFQIYFNLQQKMENKTSPRKKKNIQIIWIK